MKKIALIVAVILFLFMFLTVRMEAQDAAANEAITIVKLLSASQSDFLQMAKVDGQSKIVNVLWVMNPAALRRR